MTPTDPLQHVYWRPDVEGERNSLSVLTAYVKEGNRVLDLGIGAGALGRRLHEQLHCRLDGVTFNPDEQALAQAWYERIEVVDLDRPGWESTFEGQTYDAIVCADVLEHLKRPEQVLAACQRLLRPDGVLLVSIPNVAYAGMVAGLMQGDFEYGNEGLLDRTHLRFFTRRSFQRLLLEQGWHTRQVEVIDQPLHETEFSMAFDALPPAVGRHLLAQPDANAYQLIFVASAAAGEAMQGRHPVPTRPDVSAATFVAQLFVGTRDGFSSERRLTRHGEIGVERQTVVFDLPPSWTPWTALRLDPADRPGFFWLHQLCLHGADSQLLWSWSASADSVEALAATNRHQLEICGFDDTKGAIKLLLLGDDPYIELPLDVATARECCAQAARLEVECGWPMSADYQAAVTRFDQLALDNREQAGRLRKLEAQLNGHAQSRTSEPAVTPQPIVAPPLSPSTVQRVRHALRRLLRGDPASELAIGQAAAVFEAVVEIVVPIYNNLALTQRCLQSVLGAAGQTRYHLTLINDASTDPAVRVWLAQVAAAHRGITVIENARNLGFVETVNLGMRMAGRRDVVLLNSDTEVANDWLDRLAGAALMRDSVGTVTPFSNNATICSYPQFCVDNPLLPGYDTPRLDSLCARVNRGEAVEVPTAVGFCMYIRRACLDQVGDFDAASFGKGYGEENDFCLRATALGWRHLHALDVFVYHEGGGSFKETRVALQASALEAIRRLHPGYEDLIREFVQRDPARPFRDALDRARAQEAIGPASTTTQAQQSA